MEENPHHATTRTDDPWLGHVEQILERALAGEDVTSHLAALPEEWRKQAETVLAAQGLFTRPVRDTEDTLHEIGTREPTAVPVRAPSQPESSAPEIGPYRIEALLGSGGQGAVYLARDRRLDRQVALKILSTPLMQQGPRWERFRREAEIASQLDHPCLCTVYEAGNQGPTAYIAMRYVQGKSLAQRVADREEIPNRDEILEVVEIVERIARGLHVAHEAGIVHRDVKPANIVVDPQGQPVLLDFGLALDASRDRLTETNALLGTPAYMSPEQIAGQGRADRRTDVWSLGATLYELVTLELPFEEPTRTALYASILSRVPERPRRLNPEIPEDLQVVISVALSKELDERYQTALDLAEELRRVRERVPIRAKPAGPLRRLTRWTQRNPRLVLSLFLGLVFIVVSASAAGGWVAHERAQTRRQQLLAARQDATAAWDGLQLTKTGPERTSLALRALQTAQRWRLRAPYDPAATKAQHRAALALGEIALESEQWELATHAYEQATGLGVDDAGAAALLTRVEEARTAEDRRRREEVSGWLARARSGELAREGGAMRNAVFGIVRYPDEQTVVLLAAEIHHVAAALLEAEADFLRKGASGVEGLETALKARRETSAGKYLPEEARAVLHAALTACLRAAPTRLDGRDPTVDTVLAGVQRDTVGQGRLDAARIACEALGRIGRPDPTAREALAAYLRAEDDPLRAAAAGEALARIGDAASQDLVHWSFRRFGFASSYGRQVRRSFTGAFAPQIKGETTRAWTLRGQACASGSDWEGARRAFSRALELDPESAAAWNGRGNARRALGDLLGAIEDFSRAIEIEPTFVLAWNNRGNAFLRKGDAKLALRDYDRALAIDPNYVGALGNRANARHRLRDMQGAVRDFDLALELDPTDGSLHVNRGRLRFSLRDYRGAIRDYDRALELDPSMPMAWNNRATARRSLGDVEGAIQDYDHALELDPNLVMAWYSRGAARQERGDLQGALQDYEQAVKLGPGDPRALSNRGHGRLAKGDTAGALRDYEQALRIAPADPRLWFERGNAYRALKDQERAFNDYSQAVKLDPGYFEAWNNRGIVRIQRDPHGAIADLTRALELNPRVYEALANRGFIHAALRNYDPAEADLRRFLEVAPSHPSAPQVRTVLAQVRRQRAAGLPPVSGE